MEKDRKLRGEFMDLSTSIGGISLKNPIMPASGPLVSSYEKMIALEKMGVSCIVSKTISKEAAKVPRPCIIGDNNSIYNAELWSEYPFEFWLSDILPKLKKNLKVPLIISAGYTKEDMEFLIPRLDEFADAFEISTHYIGKELNVIGDTVKTITNLTKKPVFIKISPHITDVLEFARVVRENKAAGIVAINSLGPGMKIDLKNRRVLVGNDKGELWISGPSIKPIALAIINRIKRFMPDFTVIGVGGIKNAEDVLEFLLAGADAVQILSSAMLMGKQIYEKIIEDLPIALEKYNFSSVKDVIKTSLEIPLVKFEPSYPKIDKNKCILCGLCEKICPYFALNVDKEVYIDYKKCFGCGLCQSKCPAKAISAVF